MSRILDTRIELLMDGFVLADKLNDERRDYIEVVITKFAPDGMMFQYKAAADVADYAYEDIYIPRIQEMAAKVNRLIAERNRKNVNECEHKEIMIGNLRACQFCLAKFGSVIQLTSSAN